MIQVTIGTNTSRKQVIVAPETTLIELLEENNVDYSVGGIHLNGLAVAGNDLNKSLAEHGITDKAMLICVVKADGGIQ